MEIFDYLTEERFEEFLSFLNQDSLEERTDDGSSLLHTAVRCSNLDAVDTLINMGADVNSRDLKGDSPLHIAALLDLADIFQLLLENGADYTLRNNSLRTPQQISGRNTSQVLDMYAGDHGYTVKIPRHKKRMD